MSKKITAKDHAEDRVFVAPSDTMTKVNRYNTLMKRKKKLEAEMNAIKDELKKEMEEMEVLKYTDDHGVVRVTSYTTTRSVFDRQTAEEILGAQVVDGFYSKVISQAIRISD